MLYQKLARIKLAVYGIDGERAVIPTQIKAKDIDCPQEPHEPQQVRSSFSRNDAHSTIVSFYGQGVLNTPYRTTILDVLGACDLWHFGRCTETTEH